MTDRIEAGLLALALPDPQRMVAELHAAFDRGQPVLPLPPDLPPATLEALLDHLRPAVALTPAGRHRRPDPLPVSGDVAAVVLTSGSTGGPKAVELTWDALQASARASLERLGATRDDRWLCCLPLHHIAGIQVLVRSRLMGVEPVVHPRFEVERVAAETTVTMVSLVPTMLRRLLDAGTTLSHLRCVLLGGARPPADLVERAATAAVPVVTSYGLTETCGGCVYDGWPLEGVAARVEPDGAIAVTGPVLMQGYRNDPAATAAALRDGWLRTADLGRQLPDGRLEVLGRADDVIVSGGENIVAAQVTAALGTHPQVAEVAVVGMPDAEWGERAVAVVVPREAGPPPSLAQLRDHVGGRLSRSHAPREVVVVDALPRLASGKIDRDATRRLVLAQRPPGDADPH